MNDRPNIYTPEFIPYYWEEAKKYNFTDKETLLYGFIRFYTEKNSKKFYFSNKQLARIIRSSERTVTNTIAKFDTMGIFLIIYENKAKGGTIRFISRGGSKNCESGRRLAKIASPTSKNCESEKGSSINPPLEEKKGKKLTGKNKVNKNKKYTPFNKLHKPSKDFEDFLTKKANRKTTRNLKRKYGYVPTDFDFNKAAAKERVTITQNFQKAIVNYPTLESVDDEALIQVCKDKRIAYPDCLKVWNIVKQKVRGSGSGKWQDMVEMLKTYIDYQIDDGKIDKKKTSQEIIYDNIGEWVRKDKKPDNFTNYKGKK